MKKRFSIMVLMTVAAHASIANAQPGPAEERFTGKLDIELAPDLVHVYQRRFEVVAEKNRPQFVPSLAEGTAVSLGELIARTGTDKFIAFLAEPAGVAPFLAIDFNKNGKIEIAERLVLTPSADGSRTFGTYLKLPLSNPLYKNFPVLFTYLPGFRHPKFKPGDRLTSQSVWAHAFGTVKVGKRTIRMLYPFDPDQPSISTTEGLFGVDADGDGKIRNEEFSPETSYAVKRETVFRVGDMYLSTAKIDLVKNEIVVRTRPQADYLRHEIEVGKPMPDFSFVDIGGKTRSLYEFKGRYVLVDFWGVWCIDCIRETPFHVEAYKRFRSRGLEILGLDTDEDIEVLKAYVLKNKLTWPQARNDSIRRLVEETYRIQEYPSTILIGPDAKVLVLNQRELRGEALLTTLDRMLPK